MTTEPTLLPCPFCGEEPIHDRIMDEDLWSHNTVPYRRVRCEQCEIGTDFVCEGLEPSEVERWNSRAAGTVPADCVVVPRRASQTICQVMQAKLREWPRYPFRVAPVYEAAIRAAMLEVKRA